MKRSAYLVIAFVMLLLTSACKKLEHELPARTETTETANPFTAAKVAIIDSGSHVETTPGFYDITIYYHIDYSKIPASSGLKEAFYNVNNSSFLNPVGTSGVFTCSYTTNVHPLEIRMLVKLNNNVKSGYSDPYIIP